MTVDNSDIGPKDFDAYRAQITDCYCPLCRECAYAVSDVLDMRGRRSRAAARVLLAALQAGAHRRVEQDVYHAQARVDHDRRIAEAEAAGVTGRALEDIRRGYSTVKMSDFYATGMGLGMTPGGVGGSARKD